MTRFCVSFLFLYVWNLGREKRWSFVIALRGGVSIAAGGALLVVQLQQASLTSGPGGYSTEHHGQIVTGLTDRFISGGHQERGSDHQNERDDSGQDVVVDVLNGRFLLKKCFVFELVWGCFPFVTI